ncbi:MAG: hypothetical protein ACK4NC_03725 [Candidatus Gracilibacteria bacterium]
MEQALKNKTIQIVKQTFFAICAAFAISLIIVHGIHSVPIMFGNEFIMSRCEAGMFVSFMMIVMIGIFKLHDIVFMEDNSLNAEQYLIGFLMFAAIYVGSGFLAMYSLMH